MIQNRTGVLGCLLSLVVALAFSGCASHDWQGANRLGTGDAYAEAYDTAVIEDGPIAKDHFKRQIIALYYEDKFSDLEKMASNLRSDKTTFIDGTRKLHHFYQAFAEPRKRSPEGWERFFSRFDKWIAKYPDSVTAKTAIATACMDYAWQGRGGGFADKVTDEGWRLFRERLKKSYSYASQKPSKQADDCPERHSILLNLANYQGTDRFHFESLFNEAKSSFPDYAFYYYLDKARYLLPSWHGSKEELQKFMLETANLPPEAGGKIIYSVVIMNYWGEKAEFQTFKEDRISWEIMKQGFLEMRQKAPRSSFILNKFCMFACLAGDKATAKRLFDEIGDRPYLEAWNNLRRNGEFFKWRDWAFADDKQERRRSFPDGTEDFRQMFLLAKQGEAEAQFGVGEMMLRGELVRKDISEAVEWFLKASQQGHRKGQSSLATCYFNGNDPIENNFSKAAQWYYIAAMQGDSNAASSLGLMYMDGFGLEKDLVKAYVWYSQVTQWQEPKVKEVAAKLTPEQFTMADSEAKNIREQIRANMAVAEIRPIDPSLVHVPEFKLAPLIQYESVPQLKLPTGNLLDSVKWELSGGATFDGKTLSIKNQGEGTAQMNVISSSSGCVLIATRLRHSRPEAIVPGTPFLAANMTDGNLEGQRIFMGLLAPPPDKKKEGPWYKTHEIVATRFDGVKLRLGTAGNQEGSLTEIYDTKVIIFPSCKDANKVVEEYTAP